MCHQLLWPEAPVASQPLWSLSLVYCQEVLGCLAGVIAAYVRAYLILLLGGPRSASSLTAAILGLLDDGVECP